MRTGNVAIKKDDHFVLLMSTKRTGVVVGTIRGESLPVIMRHLFILRRRIDLQI